MLRASLSVSLALLLTPGCGIESFAPTNSSTGTAAPIQAPSRSAIAHFEGAFDAASGTLQITLVPASADIDLATTRQALGFCDDLLVGGGGLQIASVPGSIQTTLEECIPSEAERSAWGPLFYDAGGAFCATVSVTNGLDVGLSNLVAEITEITAGYEAYRFLDVDPACCGTGADLRGLTGQNVPTDVAGGAFLQAASLDVDATAEAQWTFQNAGGNFVFSGAFVGQVAEVDNGLDDDCDGRADNALGEYESGSVCREDADCSSGICDDISLITGAGHCTVRPCNGRGDPGAMPGLFPYAGGPEIECDFIEEGLCLTRGPSGGGLYNAAVEDTFDRGSSPADTTWILSTCDDAPGPAHESWGTFTEAAVSSPPSRVGESMCMRGPSDTLYDVQLTHWARGLGDAEPGNGEFAYLRDGQVCGCVTGFHGANCEFSCSDAIWNGEEEALDCGAVCGGECGPGSECSFRGEWTVDTVDYDHSSTSACDPISEDVCLGRRRIRGLYNQVSESSFDEGSRTSPAGTRWMGATCDTGRPRQTWVGANGGRPPDWVDTPMCMLDESTLFEWDITFTEWGRGPSALGAFAYTRTRAYCDCDAGAHGDACEFSCSDRIRNGEEDAVDCGGPCAPCPDRWECNQNGEVIGERVRYDFLLPGSDECDEISPGLCLARPYDGWLINRNAETDNTHETPTRTTWAVGTCDDAEAFTLLHVLFGGRFWQMIGQPICLTDTSTGISWDIEFRSWGRGVDGLGGLFSWTRDSVECGCDPGFHGTYCEHSCTDGVMNGDEIFIDCGGSECAPCEENWECQYNGSYDGEIIEYIYTRDDPCDVVSEGVCIDRSRSGGWIYNSVLETTHSSATPLGTRWARGACSLEEPAIHRLAALQRGSFSAIEIAPLCMRDTTTGISWTVNFSAWGSRRTSDGGSFTWTRDSHACVCDAGFHGDSCEHHCADGLHNGLEDHVDCGGPCAPCAENWECNFNGVFDGARADYVHDPTGETCDRVSESVCLDRNAGGGLYNSDAESVGGGEAPSLTYWASKPCAEAGTPSRRWFDLAEASTPSLINIDLCMLDESTGLEWDVFIRYWGRNSTGDPGVFELARERGGCVCDLGWSGADCSMEVVE